MDLVFWAGAKAVAGTASEIWHVDTVGAALRAAAATRQDPRFDRLLDVCTVLVDGVVVHRDQLEQPLRGSVQAEILPPFAGGCDLRCLNHCGDGREQAQENRLRVVELTSLRLIS